MSDEALRGAIRQLAASGDWPARLRELQAEMERRKRKRRNAA
jgi:hypothetical protein